MQPFRFDPTFQISTILHRDSANREDAMAGKHYGNVTTCVNVAKQTQADREVKVAAMLRHIAVDDGTRSGQTSACDSVWQLSQLRWRARPSRAEPVAIIRESNSIDTATVVAFSARRPAGDPQGSVVRAQALLD
jgi:hypothetical protein